MLLLLFSVFNKHAFASEAVHLICDIKIMCVNGFNVGEQRTVGFKSWENKETDNFECMLFRNECLIKCKHCNKSQHFYFEHLIDDDKNHCCLDCKDKNYFLFDDDCNVIFQFYGKSEIEMALYGRLKMADIEKNKDKCLIVRFFKDYKLEYIMTSSLKLFFGSTENFEWNNEFVDVNEISYKTDNIGKLNLVNNLITEFEFPCQKLQAESEAGCSRVLKSVCLDFLVPGKDSSGKSKFSIIIDNVNIDHSDGKIQILTHPPNFLDFNLDETKFSARIVKISDSDKYCLSVNVDLSATDNERERTVLVYRLVIIYLSKLYYYEEGKGFNFFSCLLKKSEEHSLVNYKPITCDTFNEWMNKKICGDYVFNFKSDEPELFTMMRNFFASKIPECLFNEVYTNLMNGNYMDSVDNFKLILNLSVGVSIDSKTLACYVSKSIFGNDQCVAIKRVKNSMKYLGKREVMLEASIFNFNRRKILELSYKIMHKLHKKFSVKEIKIEVLLFKPRFMVKKINENNELDLNSNKLQLISGISRKRRNLDLPATGDFNKVLILGEIVKKETIEYKDGSEVLKKEAIKN